MAASIVYSYQLGYNLLWIKKSVMRLLHVINLSEVNAYVHITNTVLSRSSYVVMFILLNFYLYLVTGIRYVLKTITNVAAVVYRVLGQLRLF